MSSTKPSLPAPGCSSPDGINVSCQHRRGQLRLISFVVLPRRIHPVTPLNPDLEANPSPKRGHVVPQISMFQGPRIAAQSPKGMPGQPILTPAAQRFHSHSGCLMMSTGVLEPDFQALHPRNVRDASWQCWPDATRYHWRVHRMEESGKLPRRRARRRIAYVANAGHNSG